MHGGNAFLVVLREAASYHGFWPPDLHTTLHYNKTHTPEKLERANRDGGDKMYQAGPLHEAWKTKVSPPSLHPASS